MHSNILSTLPLRRKYASIPGIEQTLTDRLLTRRQVSERVGLGRSAIYDRMARGEFPRPIDLGPKCVRWSEREIEEWIARGLIEAPLANFTLSTGLRSSAGNTRGLIEARPWR